MGHRPSGCDRLSGNVLQVSDGSLYPALHKLEHRGLITAEWKPSENKPPRQVLCADSRRPAAPRP
jgi:DNA-binding PadR family transcriptional regulator